MKADKFTRRAKLEKLNAKSSDKALIISFYNFDTVII